MSISRKKLLLNTVSVNLGCGSCRGPKLSQLFHPKPKPKPKPKKPTYHRQRRHYHSSSSSWDASTPTNTTTTATFSPYGGSSQFSDGGGDNFPKASKTVRGLGRAGGEGVAVEKDSDDPYLDFRNSMLQMILENEIYSKEDLRELLSCFLQLNSPYHHGIIVRAFTEIWNGVDCSKVT